MDNTYTLEAQTQKATEAFEKLLACYEAQTAALAKAKALFEAGDYDAAQMALSLPREVGKLTRGAAEQNVYESLGWLDSKSSGRI